MKVMNCLVMLVLMSGLIMADKNKEFKYLALGDSYTIGEKVEVGNRWPVQLAGELKKQGIKISDPLIIAKTGWTTGELLAGIKKVNPGGLFDLVTLLIGVNNQYRGYKLSEYQKEFVILLKKAIAYAGGDSNRVIVVSIPDWGVTPFAKDRDRSKIAREIDEFNQVKRDQALKHSVSYVDITLISKKAASDSSLLAEDGLHPSGKMYSLWVDKILSEVRLKKNKNK